MVLANAKKCNQTSDTSKRRVATLTGASSFSSSSLLSSYSSSAAAALSPPSARVAARAEKTKNKGELDNGTSSATSSSNPLASLASALVVAASLLLLSPLPPPCSASLLELPASRLQNSYWLVRAGESVSESQGRVDTNRATKQGTGAGLSDLGKRQVAEGALPLVAKEACGGGCFVYFGTVRRSEQIAAAIGAAAGLSQSRLIPEFSFLDPRGLGAFEGGRLSAVAEEVGAGDTSSPLWKPPLGTTGTPNESLKDVLIRVTQLVSAEVRDVFFSFSFCRGSRGRASE